MKNHFKGRSRRSAVARAGLVAGLAAAAVVGIGTATASAADQPWYGGIEGRPVEHTVEVFRETVKPWDSIQIPNLACDYGYLRDEVYSPGRIVPKGVEVVEPGWIGTTVTHMERANSVVKDGVTYYPYTSTRSVNGWSYATNWDPFTSHELVINLHCTLDPSKASHHTEVIGFP